MTMMMSMLSDLSGEEREDPVELLEELLILPLPVRNHYCTHHYERLKNANQTTPLSFEMHLLHSQIDEVYVELMVEEKLTEIDPYYN